jgi:hypothetical protein
VAQKTKAAYFRSDALAEALNEATVGDRRHLYDLLCRSSWLPGKNANMLLMWAFAQECADRGVKGDALALAMASLDADEAPGATELEFLPMCGVAAFAVRALSEPKKRAKYIGLLHECADDLRFRVRDVVVLALAKVGEQLGEVLVEELDGWMDGYFHGTAVLRALAEPGLLAKLTDADLIITRVDQAFSLAKNAERAASRYPGFKALMEALGSVPSLVASRFGTQVFDMLERWTKEKDPALRVLVEKNLDRMRGRFNTDVARVWKSLEATKPARRDPTTYVGRTRGRGRKVR